MSKIFDDPLLSGLRGILAILMGLLVFAMVVMAIAAGAIAFFPEHLEAHIAAAEPGWLRFAIAGLVLTATGLVYMAYRFVQELRRIVWTVHEGDPFVAQNADRLRNMGWLAIAMQGGGILLTIIASIVQKAAPAMEVESGIDLGGIVLGLVLFVLARVFRRGSEMREDLEGTV
ncbi:DUF2975 domain-containing protein [Alteraurantiacibacter aquimixticola]|nr:DUF2975 domain-containing protein [Alteraurantiacibacter aquimixticola]